MRGVEPRGVAASPVAGSTAALMQLVSVGRELVAHHFSDGNCAQSFFWYAYRTYFLLILASHRQGSSPDELLPEMERIGGFHGVERLAGVLEDHRDPLARDLELFFLGQGQQISALKGHPAGAWRAGDTKPMMARASTDLPEPDSPTMPSACRLCLVLLSSVRRRHRPRGPIRCSADVGTWIQHFEQRLSIHGDPAPSLTVGSVHPDVLGQW